MADYLLQMNGIVKSFGGVNALNGIDIKVKPGECAVIIDIFEMHLGVGGYCLCDILDGQLQAAAGGHHALSRR